MDELKVILHHDLPGVVRFSHDKFELERLDANGAVAKTILHTDLQNVLILKLSSMPLSSVSSNHAPSSAQSSNIPGMRYKLYISTLAFKGRLRPLNLDVSIDESSMDDAKSWVDRALKAAYGGVIPKRKKVLLLVNPVGGKGKAKSLVDSIALPILKAGGCEVEVIETKYPKHAEEIARNLSLDYDVIAAASGDGLIHEVINGFASRSDARTALRIPLAPIPTGSANGLCINLLGVKDTFNIPLACLNVIKGKEMPLDLCAVVRGEERIWSFFSQAAGLMADVDIGTDHLRWMGDTRFIWGFMRGIVSNQPMKARISIQVVSSDKALMIQQLNARRDAVGQVDVAPMPLTGDQTPAGYASPHRGIERWDRDEQVNTNGASAPNGTTSKVNLEDGQIIEGHDRLPAVRQLIPDETWMTIESGAKYGPAEKLLGTGVVAEGNDNQKWQDGLGVLYLYAGMMPYVARDLMQFPVAMPGEGVINIVVQSLVPRAALAGAITGAEKGKQFYMTCQHYYKATAFCIEPLEKDGLVSIDGEAMPFEKFTVEVHPRLARTMSLVGGWADGGFGR